MFFCSELGQLCMKEFKYQPRSRYFEEVWKRFDQEHYMKNMVYRENVLSFDTNPLKTAKESLPIKIIQEAVKLSIKEEFVDVAENDVLNSSNSTDGQTILQQYANRQETGTNGTNGTKVTKSTKIDKVIATQIINTEVGKLKEKSTIDIYCEMYGKRAKTGGIAFYKRSLMNGFIETEVANSFQRNDLWKDGIFIGGRPDALIHEQGNEIPLEAKNRQNRFFPQIPEYEFFQCLGYCFVTHQKKCIWVQRFKNNIQTENILLNKTTLNQMCLTLGRYSELLALFLKDNDIVQEYYLMNDEKTRSSFIDSFIFGKGGSDSRDSRIFI